jgi:hypothetical protein
MLLLLVVFFFYGCYVQSSTNKYYISDVRYPVPLCTVKNHSLWNIYGELRITNDLFGNKLHFQIEWNKTALYPSCHLCQIFESYCLDSSSQFAQTSDVSISNGLNYNFMVVVVKEGQPFPFNISSNAYQFNINSTTTKTEITLDIVSQLLYSQEDYVNCDETLNIIIIPIITVAIPFKRDIISIVYEYGDDDDDNASKQYFDCLDTSSKLYNKIDCSILRRYYFIKYKMTNCISQEIHNPSKILNNVSFASLSALNWYHIVIETIYRLNPGGNKRYDMTLMMNKDEYAMMIMNKMGSMNVCGRIWYDILMNSKIEQIKCSEISMLYFDMKPYVRLSLQMVVAKLNIIMKQGHLNDDEKNIFMDLMVVNDLLERHCDHYNDEIYRNETIYDSLTTRLETFNNEKTENTLSICASLIHYALLMKNFSTTIKDTSPPLPYPIYTSQYATWYFQLYQFFVLYYVSNMELNSIIFTSFLALSIIIGIILLCTILYYIYKECRFPCIRRRQKVSMANMKTVNELMKVTRVSTVKK